VTQEQSGTPEPTRTVTLVRGRHRWSFRCAPGEERALVSAAARAALRGTGGLDVADAAILARRLDAWPEEAPRTGASPREHND
jgi:hypothetical protein